MATEKDFELLDDYLSNKLNVQDKSAFEQKLGSDQELKKELEFQKQLVKGIQNVRVAELKSMLNKVPVPPSQGAGSGAVAAKISISVMVAAIAGLGIYFLFDQRKPAPLTEAATEQTEQSTSDVPSQQHEATADKPQAFKNETSPAVTEEDERMTAQPDKKDESAGAVKPEAKKEGADSQHIKQPKLNVFDPSGELEEPESKENNVVIESKEGAETIANSSIVVETDNTNKKYNFHYQFKDDKLLLYGSFDKNLIEILEFFSDNKRTIFLFFNSNYYLLDDKQVKPALLKPITDPVLLNKLKEYRNK